MKCRMFRPPSKVGVFYQGERKIAFFVTSAKLCQEWFVNRLLYFVKRWLSVVSKIIIGLSAVIRI